MPANHSMGDFSRDAQAVHAARGGDRAAFGELYERYVRMVHGVLLAHVPYAEVDDLLQDVFLIALRMSRGANRDDWANPATDLDGYAWVKKAIGIRGRDAEVEFAAALITTENSKQDYSEHVQKAKAGMKEDRLLAENVASHF
jgi:DNA-directed RNA polymerase specialized sigma24 family protein